MIILGLDPGYAIVGYGVINYEASNFKVLDYDAITTEKDEEFVNRLEAVYDGVTYLIEKHRPDAVSVESLFWGTNSKTAILVAQARGVILLAAKKHSIPVYEYTPLQVKSAVTGYGKATKEQIMEMTRLILNLREIPKPDDAADALAVAVCCAHSAASLRKL